MPFYIMASRPCQPLILELTVRPVAQFGRAISTSGWRVYASIFAFPCEVGLFATFVSALRRLASCICLLQIFVAFRYFACGGLPHLVVFQPAVVMVALAPSCHMAT